MFDIISGIYASDPDPNHDCTQNIWSGTWASFNAVDYFITRTIQGLAGIHCCLYLFYKKRVSIKMFKQGKSHKHSGVYGSDAEEILANFERLNSNISVTPDESDLSDNDGEVVRPSVLND